MALEVEQSTVQVRLDLPRTQDVVLQPQPILDGLRDRILQQVAKTGKLDKAAEQGGGGLIALGVDPRLLQLSAMSYYVTDKGGRAGPVNGNTSNAGGSTDGASGIASTAKVKTAAEQVVRIIPENTETLSEEGSPSSGSVALKFIAASKRPLNVENYNDSVAESTKSSQPRLSASLKPEANAIPTVSTTENKSRVFDISKFSVENPVLGGIIGAKLRTLEPLENSAQTSKVGFIRQGPHVVDGSRVIALNNNTPYNQATRAHERVISLAEREQETISA